MHVSASFCPWRVGGEHAANEEEKKTMSNEHIPDQRRIDVPGSQPKEIKEKKMKEATSMCLCVSVSVL